MIPKRYDGFFICPSDNWILVRVREAYDENFLARLSLQPVIIGRELGTEDQKPTEKESYGWHKQRQAWRWGGRQRQGIVSRCGATWHTVWDTITGCGNKAKRWSDERYFGGSLCVLETLSTGLLCVHGNLALGFAQSDFFKKYSKSEIKLKK